MERTEFLAIGAEALDEAVALAAAEGWEPRATQNRLILDEAGGERVVKLVRPDVPLSVFVVEHGDGNCVRGVRREDARGFLRLDVEAGERIADGDGPRAAAAFRLVEMLRARSPAAVRARRASPGA